MSTVLEHVVYPACRDRLLLSTPSWPERTGHAWVSTLAAIYLPCVPPSGDLSQIATREGEGRAEGGGELFVAMSSHPGYPAGSPLALDRVNAELSAGNEQHAGAIAELRAPRTLIAQIRGHSHVGGVHQSNFLQKWHSLNLSSHLPQNGASCPLANFLRGRRSSVLQ